MLYTHPEDIFQIVRLLFMLGNQLVDAVVDGLLDAVDVVV